VLVTLTAALRLRGAAFGAPPERFEKLFGHREQEKAPDDGGIAPEAVKVLEPDELREAKYAKQRKRKKDG
jgi:hypothetical protein